MISIKRFILPLVAPLVSVILSFFIGGIFIYLIGRDPFEVYSRLFSDTLGSSYGIGQVLFKATSLIFTGLSAAVAFRAGLLNIGAEGQLYIGSIFIAICGFSFASLPSYVHIPLCIASGLIGGALWGFIPGVLKARFGSHEVINTIMLNFIAFALTSYLVNHVFVVPATVHTPQISSSAELLRFDSFSDTFRGSPLNLSLLIALLACLMIFYSMRKTPLGYEINVLGLNRNASRYARMNLNKLIILTMTLSGALAGLGGTNFVMGYKHYFELGFSENTGYIGLAVAIIGKNNPVGIIFASLFFGLLEYGGLTVNTIVPKEFVTMLQAVIIFFIIIISKLTAHVIPALPVPEEFKRGTGIQKI